MCFGRHKVPLGDLTRHRWHELLHHTGHTTHTDLKGLPSDDCSLGLEYNESYLSVIGLMVWMLFIDLLVP